MHIIEDNKSDTENYSWWVNMAGIHQTKIDSNRSSTNLIKIISNKFTKGPRIFSFSFSAVLFSINISSAGMCAYIITPNATTTADISLIDFIALLLLFALTGIIVYLGYGMYSRRSKFKISQRQIRVFFVFLSLIVLDFFFLAYRVILVIPELALFRLIVIIFYLLFSIFPSFSGAMFFLFITGARECLIDLNNEEIVLRTRFSILEGNVEERIKEKILKGRIITKKESKEIIVLETGTQRKIHIPGEFDPPIDNYPLMLGVLYLIKYLEIPFTLKTESFAEKIRGKIINHKIFQNRNVFTGDWRGSEQFEKILLRLAWKKAKDDPVVLEQVGVSKGRLLIFAFLFVLLPSFLIILIVIYSIIALLHSNPLSRSEGELLLIAPLAVGLVSFLRLYSMSIKRLVRIDDQGLQSGEKKLGISTWSICWPYEFIQTLKIERETETPRRHKNKEFTVMIDFFLGTQELGRFGSKEEAERFQEYISHQIASFQGRRSSYSV
ncbi:MAG: hypothetical protein ACFFBD_07155 [Candidatus Hodarchaeota archaeon]